MFIVKDEELIFNCDEDNDDEDADHEDDDADDRWFLGRIPIHTNVTSGWLANRPPFRRWSAPRQATTADEWR